jgi:hypothetical protein
MSKRLAVALSAALLATSALHAQTNAPPAWIARSNADAQTLLDVIARFSPESASQFGLAGYDDKVADLKPQADVRFRAALVAARAKLQTLLAAEKDPNVRQDLQILMKAADRQIEGIDLDNKYLLPYDDVGEQIFNGEFALLQDTVDAKRRPAALKRLQCYVGQAPGCTPITELAKAQTTAKLGDKALIGPYRGEVEKKLGNTPRYIDGIRQLFAKYKLDDPQGKAALDALATQLADYDRWVSATVLPRARTDFRLPEPLYAYDLRQVGIDIPPQELMKQAELEFVELRGMLQVLAPVVAKSEGLQVTDYRDVWQALKKQQLGKDEVVPWYHQVLGKIEDIIRREHIVTLPQRQMIMRLASDAEAAQVPAPHMLPPPFINNHGEQGTFVLTMGNPAANGDKSGAYDDLARGPTRPRAAVCSDGGARRVAGAQPVRLQQRQRGRLGALCGIRNAAVRAAGRPVCRVSGAPDARRTCLPRPHAQSRPDHARTRARCADPRCRPVRSAGARRDRALHLRLARPGHLIFLRLHAHPAAAAGNGTDTGAEVQPHGLQRFRHRPGAAAAVAAGRGGAYPVHSTTAEVIRRPRVAGSTRGPPPRTQAGSGIT